MSLGLQRFMGTLGDAHIHIHTSINKLFILVYLYVCVGWTVFDVFGRIVVPVHEFLLINPFCSEPSNLSFP
jgi:hypothetical protein